MVYWCILMSVVGCWIEFAWKRDLKNSMMNKERWFNEYIYFYLSAMFNDLSISKKLDSLQQL